MPDQNQIILRTKLHRPHLTSDLVTRARLIERLNYEIDQPLILVCASAGFGKSTLVSNWLGLMAAGKAATPTSLPAAWISLDENDSDLKTFLHYFIAAIRTIFADACERSLALLQARQQLPQTVLYTTFCNELEGLTGEFILVLDDYHTIRGTEVHNLLGELVRHWPRSLHLVLISRINPPIPLSSLRAKGMVSEIRTRDLRFTTEETAAYLSRTQFALMSKSILPLLEERFEGWPAGLHLAAISMRSASSQEAVLSALSGEHTNITGYLLDEVLSHQVPAIHSFLLKTSILDRFCASSCEAVLGETDPAWNARSCLDWIERSELFLIPLDNQREWYRYHHLFQELLQQRASAEMPPDQIADLHHRASAWFEEQGLFDEAIHHALAAGDLDLAARQMCLGLRDVLNREDRPTLERWLSLLPEEMIQRRPDLLMIRAWALQFVWQINLQLKVLQQVDELLDSEAGASLPVEDLQILRAQILLLKSQYMFFSNQTTLAIDMCREVLALLPPTWSFARGSAMLYLGFSMQGIGQLRAAETLLLAEYAQCSDKTDIYPLILLQTMGFIYLLTGQLEQAIQIGQALIQGATHSGIMFTKNWGDYYIGVASYLRNDLETAHQYFAQIVKNRYIAHGSVYRDAVAGLALIHQIKGESAEARLLIEAMSRSDLEETGSEDSRTHSLRARLQFLQGDLEDASRWVDTFSDLPPDVPLMWLEEPQVTRVRVLLARGDLRSARQILDVLDEITDRTHNTRYKIEILALRALALDAQGEASEAERLLKQALELARPGGFIRVFVDLGIPLQELLRRLEKLDRSELMIQRILAAFSEDDVNLVSSRNHAQPGQKPSLSHPALAAPLTPRELEVLSLLRGPSSIKEIALNLHISYATAKRHTINIYGKLGVNQRWDAVARAEELNILLPR